MTALARLLPAALITGLIASQVCGHAVAAPLSGAEVKDLVIRAMTAAGETATDVPVPLRPLPDCAHEPAVAPFQGRWTTAELSCKNPPWTRVLRTTAPATPGLRPADAAPAGPVRQALVSTHSLARGAVLQESDLKLTDTPALGSDAVFTDTGDLIGRRMRADLARGEPLLARHLEPDFAVSVDIPASLSAGTGGITVTSTVLPLQNGQLGEVIRVRHPVSGRIIHATVSGPNSLRIEPNNP